MIRRPPPDSQWEICFFSFSKCLIIGKQTNSFMETELILLMWVKTFPSAFKQAVLHPVEKNMVGLHVKDLESNQAGSGF